MERKGSLTPWLALGAAGSAAAYWLASKNAAPAIDARTRERLTLRRRTGGA